MTIIQYSNRIDEYLKKDDVIDYNNEANAVLAVTLFQKADNEWRLLKQHIKMDTA